MEAELLSLDLLVFGIIALSSLVELDCGAALFVSGTDLEASQTHGFYLSLIVIFVNIS